MQRPLLFMLACSIVAAFPLHFPVILNRPALRSIDYLHVAHYSNLHIERMPRSAELLFTASDDDEISHVWLPLGKRLHTNDHQALPLHPASAKIVNVLGLSTRSPAQSKRQQATCIIRTRADRLRNRAQPELEVAFQEGEGIVRLDEASSPYDLTGREVESYECF